MGFDLSWSQSCLSLAGFSKRLVHLSAELLWLQALQHSTVIVGEKRKFNPKAGNRVLLSERIVVMLGTRFCCNW